MYYDKSLKMWFNSEIDCYWYKKGFIKQCGAYIWSKRKEW